MQQLLAYPPTGMLQHGETPCDSWDLLYCSVSMLALRQKGSLHISTLPACVPGLPQGALLRHPLLCPGERDRK